MHFVTDMLCLTPQAKGIGYDIHLHHGVDSGWTFNIPKLAFAEVGAVLAPELPQRSRQLPEDTRLSLSIGNAENYLIITLAPPTMPPDSQLFAAANAIWLAVLSARSGAEAAPKRPRRHHMATARAAADAAHSSHQQATGNKGMRLPAAADVGPPGPACSSGGGFGGGSGPAQHEPLPAQAADVDAVSHHAAGQAAAAYLQMKLDDPTARVPVFKRFVRKICNDTTPAAIDFYTPGASWPCTVKVRNIGSLDLSKKVREQMQHAAGVRLSSASIVEFQRLPERDMPQAPAVRMRILRADEATAAIQREAAMHASNEWAHWHEHSSDAHHRPTRSGRLQTRAAAAAPIGASTSDGSSAARAVAAALPLDDDSAATAVAAAAPNRKRPAANPQQAASNQPRHCEPQQHATESAMPALHVPEGITVLAPCKCCHHNH